MKHLATLLIVVLPLLISAQTGGIVVSFSMDTEEAKILTNVEIEVWKDSVILKKDTANGVLIVRNLPPGLVQLSCIHNGRLFLSKKEIRIQSKQLVYATFSVDTNYLASLKSESTNYDWIAGVGENPATKNQNNLAIVNRPTSTMHNPKKMHVDGINLQDGLYNLEEVSIVAYKTPLIDKDGGTHGVTITREDISRMPTRTVAGMASPVGGVNLTENSGLHIRGSRSDATAYYIDGIRVRGSTGMPKACISEVKVFIGGVPAKYGDATGGIIAIETMPIQWNKMITYPSYVPITSPSFPSRVTEPVIEKGINFDHFSEIYENDFLSPLTNANSTFGIDVDQASWTYIKTRYQNGSTINRDAVKLEEMINSFKQKEVELLDDELIGVELERTNCAWNPENELVTIRLRATDLPKDQPRPAHNIVLLVDVSGSMSSSQKLPLLIRGMKEFVGSLCELDKISIVTYAGSSGVVLEPTDCSKQRVIQDALSQLQSGGGTNGIGGISTAYELAEKYYDPKLNNRIILATDGDFNVGISSTSELEQYISGKRGHGIYLTALGFGMGNYKNSILESLADNGDGNHFYINNLAQCKKVLMEDIGNLINVARDVKLNVEFNPKLVKEYRLIGYENRLMPSHHFEDDGKDGGEMGYGHTVTAVYEVKRGKAEKQDGHFVKQQGSINKRELAFVKLRYKPMEDSVSIERTFTLKEESEQVDNELINLIASFGLYLRNSAFKGILTKEELLVQANAFNPKNKDERELKSMVLSLK